MPTEPAAYCYRLYIGEATVANVLLVLNRFGLSATVYPRAYGLWKGSLEPTVVVEIVRERILDGDIRVIARSLAREFGQDCVLVMRSDIARAELVKQD